MQILLLACATFVPQGPAIAASERAFTPADFAAPTRLLAGDKLLGEGRLYPSPVFHDLDGDGRLDIVVGDLRGHLTVAPAVASSEGRLAYGAEQKVNGADGKIIDFHNW